MNVDLAERQRIEALFKLERELWFQGIRNIAGIDEAGRGPLAGPVVAAAVIFNREVFIPGVNDSKLLTAKRRNQLFDRILSEADAVAVGQASPEEIDSMNILQASLLAMRRAVDNLPLQPEYLLIDGCWTLPNCPHAQMALVKGDRRSFSISAASIVAKVVRDRQMLEFHQDYPQYGFDRHKGYPTRDHVTAINKYGYCDIHRRSFKVKL
ncbi:MAG: ribonuclease HII [bacterium]|nr:ribonuclease HII [bacterium]